MDEKWGDLVQCRRPLRVECGVAPFDETIRTRRKHPGLIATLKRRMLRHVRDTPQLIESSSRLRAMPPHPIRYILAEARIARLFDGIEPHVQLDVRRPAARLRDLKDREEDYLRSAYELFHSLGSYSIFQERAWYSD